MAYRVIRGVGRSRLYAIETRAGVLLDYTWPLTEQNGYTEIWSDHIITNQLQTLDRDNPVVSEEDFVIGDWAQWELRWENFPLPIEPVEKIRDFKNFRIQYRDSATHNLRFFFQPKVMVPEIYQVNIRSLDIVLNNSDAAGTLGNFGVKLIVKTVNTQLITFPDPNDTRSYTIGDEGFYQILLQT